MRHIILPLLILLALSPARALDLSLADCREMALLADENLKIAQNNLAGADLDRAVARTAYLPKIAGSASALYYAPDSKMMDMITLQLRGAYMAGISLTQPIYTGGKITAANKMAAIGAEASREQLRAARMDVIAGAEKAYWTLVAVRAKVDMMESYKAMMDSVYLTTSVAVNAGMAPHQALLRVDTRRSEIVYRLGHARSGADICRMALCRIIGVADSVAITPTESVGALFELPAGELDISGRPELALLQKNIDIRKQEVNMARADFLPTLGLQVGWNAYGNIRTKGITQDATGNYVPFSTTTNSDGFMGVLSLQVPIFHWGEGIKKVRRAKIEVENASLTLERNRRLMELEANQYYTNLMTGFDLVSFAEKAMAEAEENLSIMRRQYDNGLTTLTDLLEAQSQWQSSYSNLIEARTQLRISLIDYLRSTGTLD